ncbi:hypothetical protein C1I89_12530 [Achromobacter pulmonis]|uniref:FecR N-terminal domain-containing protein n=1 Tax=Achromobacter pulmonis TaxID=1389932 RepID=A0A2N8KIN2_9BURK|nr:hypothetical protein C1I89_12530 [Achromobacter pulmonis]
MNDDSLQRKLLEEAADWHGLMSSGEVSAQDREACRQWRERSARHTFRWPEIPHQGPSGPACAGAAGSPDRLVAALRAAGLAAGRPPQPRGRTARTLAGRRQHAGPEHRQRGRRGLHRY